MSPRQTLAKPKDAILDAATDLFSQNGYGGTTIRDIAKVVGVLPGSLYAHIQSKDEVLLEIVEAGIDQFLEAAEATASIKDPQERLRAAIKNHVMVVAENPNRMLVVFHQWRYLAGESRERVLEKRRRYEEVFAKIIKSGMRAGVFNKRLDQRIAVLSALGALNWTAEWLHPEGPRNPEEIAERLADAILMGLLTT
jgi:TetR/AcrR family transcriptional regulator, cholesterol catabolism regulator